MDGLRPGLEQRLLRPWRVLSVCPRLGAFPALTGGMPQRFPHGVLSTVLSGATAVWVRDSTVQRRVWGFFPLNRCRKPALYIFLQNILHLGGTGREWALVAGDLSPSRRFHGLSSMAEPP